MIKDRGYERQNWSCGGRKKCEWEYGLCEVSAGGMTLKLPLSQDVETAMAKLKAHEEERDRALAGSSGGPRGEFLSFCFAFLISVASVQWLKCIQSLSSGQALGSWFMLTKLIRDGLIKKKKKKEVDWLIYTETARQMGLVMSLDQLIPSALEKYTWEAKLRTELHGKWSVRKRRTGDAQLHYLNGPLWIAGICQGV